MYVIDAHQHLWKYDPVKHSWINDQMSILKQDFLPENLELVFKENKVNGCVAVQADQSEQETKFLLGLAEKSNIVKGVVGWIDLMGKNLGENLEKYQEATKLCGFRHVVQDEPDPNFMLQADFQKGLAVLTSLNYTYDILVFPTQMEAAIKTVQNHLNQKFVLDHIAKPYIKSGKIKEWSRQIQELASYDHVYCKVSGIITEADWANWKYEELVPYLDCIIEHFGTDRVMYGSDWPVCLLAGKYSEVKQIISRYIASLSESEQEKVWSKNAIEFYNLSVK